MIVTTCIVPKKKRIDSFFDAPVVQLKRLFEEKKIVFSNSWILSVFDVQEFSDVLVSVKFRQWFSNTFR